MKRQKQGRLEVIAGCMFCGKTDELIRRLRREQIVNRGIQVFYPAVDTRYGAGRVTSHAGGDFEAVAVDRAERILDLVRSGTDVVGIDEAQFFDPAVVGVVQSLTGRGLRVIIAGLDQDFRGEPFGSVAELLALADEVLKLCAICLVCGEAATRTQRLIDGKPAHFDEPVVLVGGAESYEARCRSHHEVPGRPESVHRRRRGAPRVATS